MGELKKLRLLDLFSGIGGFSLGLERTGGFETVAFCEIDPFCLHWFNETTLRQYTVSDGPIIRTEQQTYILNEENRTCTRCGLVDRRVVSTEYIGWE